MAGGRLPESIIRSVRSVFSLRSLRSRLSGSRNAELTNGTGTDFQGLKSDSQLELNEHTGNWSRAEHDVQIGVASDKSDVKAHAINDGVINVTRDINVDRY